MNGFLACLMYVGYIACAIASGLLAWNWADPDGFWSFIWFMVLWGIIGSIASFVWNFLCVILGSILGKDD